MAKPKKPASIYKKVNGRTLYAEKGLTGWHFASDDFPDLAEKYDGCQDASDAITEFELRATAGGKKLKESA